MSCVMRRISFASACGKGVGVAPSVSVIPRVPLPRALWCSLQAAAASRSPFRCRQGLTFPTAFARLATAAVQHPAGQKSDSWSTFAPGNLLLLVPKWRNWQTRMVQVHVLARVWGFESLLRHQIFKSQFLRRESILRGALFF